MKDFLELGPVPGEETCIQVDKDINYFPDMRKECQLFLIGLEGYFHDLIETSGVQLRVKTFQHDFGPYCEVCVFFDDSNEEQFKAAYEIENKCPSTWEELENGKTTTFSIKRSKFAIICRGW